MKTIQLEIEDTSLDAFLILINSLKDGMIRSFKIDDDNIKDDFKKVAKELSDIKNNKYKPMDAREFLNDL